MAGVDGVIASLIALVHNPLAADDLGRLERYPWLGEEPVCPEFEWAAEVIYYCMQPDMKLKQVTSKVSLKSLIQVYCMPGPDGEDPLWPGLIDELDRIARTATPEPLRERLQQYLDRQVKEQVLPAEVCMAVLVPSSDPAMWALRTWTQSWWALSCRFR